MKLYIIILSLSSILNAYQLGHGLEVNKYLSIGGYFSSKYENSNGNKKFMLDDVALLGYGRLGSQLSYLMEFEAREFWVRDFANDKIESNINFHIERAYLNYTYNDYLNVTVGKFITPIGYWNLTPINVLQDTTSSPKYATEIYPKFTTGIKIFGYLPFDDTINYNIFLQKNRDIDPKYNNIKTDNYYGVELKKSFDNLILGVSFGEYEADEEHRKYLATSFKYTQHNIQLIGEYALVKYNQTNDKSQEYNKYAYYIQGRYKLNSKHFIITRYEKSRDSFHDIDEDIKLIGYNYRPIYPISLKCEYQFNNNKDENKLLLSFSMLF